MITKEDRQQCWNARDSYFACLDRHNIISSRQPSTQELMRSSNNPFHRSMDKLPVKAEEDPHGNTMISKKGLPAECEQLVQDFRKMCVPSWVKIKKFVA
jgi:cytochrome c oxidase assembly factor 6